MRPKTKSPRDQGDPPVIELPTKTKLSTLQRKRIKNLNNISCTVQEKVIRFVRIKSK